MRFVVLTLLCLGSGAFAQMDDCTMRCGQDMAECGQRCGTDQSCGTRCVKHMDDCNMRCNARGKVQSRPSAKVTMCPGANGKSVPCSDMTDAKAPPKKAKPKQHTINELKKMEDAK
jgi:hypothetical protein